jgi:hypothetical protein
VTLSLRDDEGEKGSVAKYVNILPPVGEHWALIVQSYTNSLGYANVKGMLRANGWPLSNIKDLASRRLNRSTITGAFNWLKSNVGPNDKVLVWFGTHGWNLGWEDLNISLECGLKFGEGLLDWVAYWTIDMFWLDLSSDYITVVLDACKSGCGVFWLAKDERIILSSCGGVGDGRRAGIFRSANGRI